MVQDKSGMLTIIQVYTNMLGSTMRYVNILYNIIQTSGYDSTTVLVTERIYGYMMVNYKHLMEATKRLVESEDDITEEDLEAFAEKMLHFDDELKKIEDCFRSMVTI